MKITEAELKAIIDEEIQSMIDEGVMDRLKAKGSGAIAKLNPFADKGDAALRQAISLMGSYGNHLLKLQQKLQKDAAKLGIEAMPDIQKALDGINQTRQMVVKTAKEAPRSERFKAAVAKAAAEQGAQQQAQPQAQQQAAQPQAQQQPVRGGTTAPLPGAYTPQQQQAVQQPAGAAPPVRGTTPPTQQQAAAPAEDDEEERARRAAAQRTASQANTGPANESKTKEDNQ